VTDAPQHQYKDETLKLIEEGYLKLTEQERSAISAKKFHLGEVAMAETVPKLLNEIAASLFAERKDDLALFVRDKLAATFTELAKTKRDAYHREFGKL
jgi:hypothetical protein